MPIIAIHGKIGSGKDTLAKLIMENSQHKWENVKFATLVKEITAQILNIPVENLESQDFKSSEIPNGWNMTYRKFMQTFANNMRDNINQDIWCKSLIEKYNPDKDYWIITDLRYPNEYDYIKKSGGDIYKIWRNKDVVDTHFSEIALDHMSDDSFTMVIDNNYSLEQLNNTAKQIAKKYE